MGQPFGDFTPPLLEKSPSTYKVARIYRLEHLQSAVLKLSLEALLIAQRIANELPEGTVMPHLSRIIHSPAQSTRTEIKRLRRLCLLRFMA